MESKILVANAMLRVARDSWRWIRLGKERYYEEVAGHAAKTEQGPALEPNPIGAMQLAEQ
jgi:hypothetical protein